MRALPFFLLVALSVFGPWPATSARDTEAAASLLPLVQALHGRPTGALVESYADGIQKPPAMRSLENELLSGASWTRAPLGQGVRYTARRGRDSAEIVELPLPKGRMWVLCTRLRRVMPQRLGAAELSLTAPPCGTKGQYAAVTARVPGRVGKSKVEAAMQSLGIASPVVLSGSSGVFALGLLPAARPSVAVGGVQMNLALRVSYDIGHGGTLTVATPTLSGVGPW